MYAFVRANSYIWGKPRIYTVLEQFYIWLKLLSDEIFRIDIDIVHALFGRHDGAEQEYCTQIVQRR